MKVSRVPSSLCAVLTASALSLAPISCKDEKKEGGDGHADKDKDAPKDGADGGAKAADGAAKSDDDGGGGGDGDGGLVATAKAAAGIVTGLRDIEPSYPKDLDAVLNLVPADADTFIVVRDVGSIVDGTLGYLEAGKTTFDKVGTEIAKEDPAEAAEMQDGLKKIVEFEKALKASGIDMSAGAVIAKKGEDKAIVVYGSATADALPTMLTAVGAKENLPDKCVAVASAAGYAVCTSEDPAVYAPGSKAAELRKKLSDALPGVDLDRGNILAHFKTDDGEQISAVVETGQGMAHVAFAVPQARKDVAGAIESGKAAGLGLIGPGQPFMWAQGSKKQIADAGASAPPMAQNVVKTLTGEFLAGGITGAKGFAVLVGLTDPAPVAGLVALASLGLGEVPKELPDGTKIEAAVKTIGGAQAVHVKFAGGSQEKVFKELGYASEVFGFAAGQYAAVTLGASQDVVDTIAKYTDTGPSKEMLEALPAPLAKALEAGEPAFAMYVPFDALQAAGTQKAFDAVAAAMPMGEMGKTDPKVALGLFLDVMAPMSSVSMWLSQVDKGPVFHIAVQGLADAGTDEGKAALEAMAAVAGGADRKATYEGLAAKYPSSARSSSYKARAGQLGDPFSAVFVVAAIGGMAGAALFMRSESGPVIEPVLEESPPAPPAPPPPMPE